MTRQYLLKHALSFSLMAGTFMLPLSIQANNDTPLTGATETVVSTASTELAAPIIALMPHVKALRAELNLSAEQNQTIDAWLAEAPAKRQSLEKETVAVRAQLRNALLERAPRTEREALKTTLAEQEKRLTEMRSLCARMLYKTLDSEQYAKVVARYRASL